MAIHCRTFLHIFTKMKLVVVKLTEEKSAFNAGGSFRTKARAIVGTNFQPILVPLKIVLGAKISKNSALNFTRLQNSLLSSNEIALHKLHHINSPWGRGKGAESPI